VALHRRVAPDVHCRCVMSSIDFCLACPDPVDGADSATGVGVNKVVHVDWQPSGVDPVPARGVSAGASTTFQVRIHGREGHGATTAARLLADAIRREGWWSEAPPSFGRERSGAPVEATCRAGDAPIRGGAREAEINAIIVQDAHFVHYPGVFRGLSPDGYVLVNSSWGCQHSGLHLVRALPRGHVLVVRATELAMRHVGRAVPNTALLGAFAAMTGLVSLESINAAIRELFSGPLADGNVAAASRAYLDVVDARLNAASPTADGRLFECENALAAADRTNTQTHGRSSQ
jgi:pyruvate ferredoxin oxidoreductase gamma subunit